MNKRVGKRFGMLVIIDELGGKRGGEQVKCKCDCGKELILPYRQLINKIKNSCGCCSYEEAKKKGIREKRKKGRMQIIGGKYGKLTVIEEVKERKGKRYFKCKCDCGEVCIVEFGNLRNHLSTSCGCSKWLKLSKSQDLREYRKRKELGVVSKERLYKIWRNMIDRCYNTKNISYGNYGGRGIVVCEEWKQDYLVFKKWALENGYAEKLTIDRLDGNLGYSPVNCRWVTMKIQNNNKRNNVLVEYNGEIHTIAEWAEITGVKYNKLRYWIKKGANIDDIK